MKRVYLYIVILVLSMSSLYATIGTSQQYLVNMTPNADANDILSNVSPTFTFSKPIVKRFVKKRTIHLHQISPKKGFVRGEVILLGDTSLAFMPSQPLKKGTYRIKVKPIKLLKENQVAFKPKTSWQKFIVWLCGIMYDGITECPLCKYFCTLDNTIKTKSIVYTFEVKGDASTVTALDVNATLIELSEYNRTSISVTAIYDDNTTEDVTQKATYRSNDSSIDIDKGIITSNGEGSAIITIDYGGKTSTVQAEVYEMIGGHLLPHEPDKPDDTLLGVDANNNGVRDDVERWIYKTEYSVHPEINRAIAMQEAKFYQMALVDPGNTDDKVRNLAIRFINCGTYYRESRNLILGQEGRPLSFSLIFKDKYFNTRERLKTYMDYNYGTGKIKVYTSTPRRLLDVSYCDENIDLLP